MRHPSLLGYELLWRWIFGVPALIILAHQAYRIWLLVPQTTLVQLQTVAYDPVQASIVLAALFESLGPSVLAVLKWMLPLYIIAWSMFSGAGRWLVLRRLARLRPELLPPPRARQALRLVMFQALRIIGLVAAFLIAYLCIREAAAFAFSNSEKPNLVFYMAAVIISVLAVFTVWAFVSWIINLAPLLLVREQTTATRAIMESVRAGRTLTGKLTEINLVLGIVKLASLVLAMVFSSIPIPFESATTPEQIHAWWAIVTVAYIIANELFQVVRVVASLEMVEHYRPAS